MKWPVYTKYKDSGIEWLGQVPEGWGVGQLKWTIMFQRGHDLPSDEREDGIVPLVTSAGISATHSKAVAKGPGIVTGRYGTIGTFHLIDQDYWPLNTTLYSISLRGNDPVYLRYMLMHLSPLFLLNAIKSAVPGIDRNDIHSVESILVPLREQHAIAAFLDRETGRIDLLVSKKRTLIERLKEKRSALISRTVTRGLPPAAAREAGLPENPPLKPSGIDWLGDVPEHWVIKQLRWVGQCITGLTYSPEQVVSEGEGTLVLRSSNIQRGTIVFDDNVFVNAMISDELVTREGDILLCSRNGSQDLVGKCGRITPMAAGLTFGAFTTVFRSSTNKFAYYLFQSELFRFQAALFQTSTIYQLTIGVLNAMRVPLPPLREQQAIAAYLDAETARLDALVAKVETAIERLLEYRTALITAAVTGKIDVRGAIQ